MKAIIADVDDTICASTKPASKEMIYQIDRLIDAGLVLAFISGGTVNQISDQLTGVMNEIHILGGSGTHYVTKCHLTRSFNEIYKRTLMHDQKVEILNAFEKLIKEFNIKTLTTKEDQLQDRDTQITLSALGRHAPDDLKRNFDPNGSVRADWISYLRDTLQNEYEIRLGGTTSIDITNWGQDKRDGIRSFLNETGFAEDDVLFFGDKIFPNGNDYTARFIVDCISVRNEHETLNIFETIKPSFSKAVK